jgi:curli biogenesis system outer membrane secretion channel CsgG
MTRNRRNILTAFLFLIALLFLLTSCAYLSNLPLIGKKKEKVDQLPEGKTVSIEGMETVKGVNPPKTEPPPATRPSAQPTAPKIEKETQVASIPTRPAYSPSLPFFQLGFKRKVAILDFENKTTYKEEKIGEAVAKRLSDKLEATQRVVTVEKTVVSEMLDREGFKLESMPELSVMKRAHQSLGIQAFALGTVTDLSLLSSKASETSEEEVTFATLKMEIRLIDASTGNLLKSFIGRSPIFGTKETGEYSKSKAVLKAIDLALDDILEGFLRQLDLLEWTTTVAQIEGENLYINAGKLSGLRIGDTLEVFEPGKEIIHPTTKFSLGWTTGQLRGIIRITDLFGVDAAIGKVVQGKGFSSDDVVKSAMK